MPTRDLTRALEDKFKFAPKQSGDERFCFYLDGELAAHTKVSRGWTDVDDKMVSLIANQVGVTSKELRAMVDCTFGPAAYEQKIRAASATPAATVKSVPRKSSGGKRHGKGRRGSGRGR